MGENEVAMHSHLLYLAIGPGVPLNPPNPPWLRACHARGCHSHSAIAIIKLSKLGLRVSHPEKYWLELIATTSLPSQIAS